jgi:hypothetical protein
VAAQTPDFGLPLKHALPGVGSAAASGDFDADGDLDIATLSGGGRLSVSINQGGGRFVTTEQAGVDFPGEPVPYGPRPPHAADFDGDGLVDLVVYGDRGSGCGATVLSSTGDGSFNIGSSIEATTYGAEPRLRCRQLEIADFNGDAVPDIALAFTHLPLNPDDDYLTGAFNVFLGRGDGTFEPPSFSRFSPDPTGRDYYVSAGMTSGDFDGDGITDLAFPCAILWGYWLGEHRLETFRGDGRGNFLPATLQPLPWFYWTVRARAADFTGDGHPDLVLADSAIDERFEYPAWVVTNAGDGTFGEARVIGQETLTVGVEIGDFDADGTTDVLLASADDRLTLLAGHGDGQFEPARVYATGTAPRATLTGDFDADGRPDLAMVDSDSPALSMVLSGGGPLGQLLPVVTRVSGLGVEPVLTLADFDADGLVDVLVFDGSQLNVVYATGNGAFVPGSSLSTGSTFPWTVAALDLNGDGLLDLALPDGDGFSVVTSSAERRFFGSVNVPSWQQLRILATALGDVDGDGDGDLAVFSLPRGTIDVYLGDGIGGLSLHRSLASDVAVAHLSFADLNADGHLDLFAGSPNGYPGEPEPPPSRLLLGDGTGDFSESDPIDAASWFYLLDDVNGDGALDLIHPGAVLLGRGDGRFAPPLPMPDGVSRSIAIGDLDGDGQPDRSAAGSDGLVTARGNGDGTFGPVLALANGSFEPIGIADVTGDGAPDLLTLRSFANINGYWPEVVVFRSASPQPPTACTAPTRGDGRAHPRSARVSRLSSPPSARRR